MILALLISAALTAPTPRFKRFDSRKIEGRSSRGFLSVATSSAAAYVPMFSFAPTGGAGLGGDCSCSDVTNATGTVPLTFTRSTVGLCVSEQTFAECATNKPRIQGGAFLKEAAATNLALRNGDLTNPVWGNIATTRTAGQTDPLGGTNATRIQNAACPIIGTFVVVFQNPVGVTNTAASVWIKEASSGPGTAQMYVYGTAKKAVPMAYDSAWRRYELLDSGASNEIGFGCVHHALVTGSSDTGAADFLVFRPQYEDSLFTTSAIPTVASAVARGADSVLSGTLPTIVGPGNFCVAASVQKTNAGFTGTTSFIQVGDSGGDDITAGLTSAAVLTLAADADSQTPTVASVSTTIHRLVWGNVSGVGSATWDLSTITPVPSAAASQANDTVEIGADNTLTSRVIVDASGCN